MGDVLEGLFVDHAFEHGGTGGDATGWAGWAGKCCCDAEGGRGWGTGRGAHGPFVGTALWIVVVSVDDAINQADW